MEVFPLSENSTLELFPTGGDYSCLPPIHVVRVQLTDPGVDTLNIAELEVYDEYNTNVALDSSRATAELSSEFTTGPTVRSAWKATDGDVNTFCQTNPEEGASLQIVVPTGVHVSHVVIVNREDNCCRDRLFNSVVSLISRNTTTPSTPCGPVRCAQGLACLDANAGVCGRAPVLSAWPSASHYAYSRYRWPE